MVEVRGTPSHAQRQDKKGVRLNLDASKLGGAEILPEHPKKDIGVQKLF